MIKLRLILGTLALTLASTSCLRQKTALARVFIPPSARPLPSLPDEPGPLPDPPQLAADLASLVPPLLPGIAEELNNGIPEAPRRVARRQPTHVDVPKPPVTSAGPATPESPAPRLAQMFTPEELRQNTRTLEESLDRVNRALTIVEAKNLTNEQKEIAERIRTFRKQAEQAREQDLLTAVSLAKRADLLAKDLLERLP